MLISSPRSVLGMPYNMGGFAYVHRFERSTFQRSAFSLSETSYAEQIFRLIDPNTVLTILFMASLVVTIRKHKS